MIEIQVDTSVLDRRLARIGKELPFATAMALTFTARAVSEEITQALPAIFDRPNPFTMKAIGFRPAQKAEPVAEVYVRRLQAGYLQLQIEGGTRRPKKRALVLPFGPGTETRYGGLKRGLVKQLLNEPYIPSPKRATRVTKRAGKFVPYKAPKRGAAYGGGVFSGVPKGRGQRAAGIYRRSRVTVGQKGGKLTLLVPYEPLAQYRQRFDFYGLTRKAAARHLPVAMQRALARVLNDRR